MNGVRIGRVSILHTLLSIPQDQRVVLSVCSEAAVGTAKPRPVAQPIGATARPAAGTATWASASLGWNKVLLLFYQRAPI